MRTILAATALLAACAEAPAPDATQADAPALMTWPDLTDRVRPTDRIGEVYDVHGDAAEGRPLRASVWVPPGGGPHPVVLMIHGGCWQKDIADRTLMDWIAADLWGRGVAVVNAEYRGVDEPGGGYPGTFADVAAVGALISDPGVAASFRLDPTRVVAVGHSAGGHLALWLAGSQKLAADHPARAGAVPALRGVVSLGGLMDLEEAEPVTLPSCLADVREALTGAPSAARPDPYSDTSPDRLLPLGVPQVLIHAERDRIAPPSLGEAWVAEATAAGDEATLVIVPGGHVELIAPDTPAWEEAVRRIEALLKGEG